MQDLSSAFLMSDITLHTSANAKTGIELIISDAPVMPKKNIIRYAMYAKSVQYGSQDFVDKMALVLMSDSLFHITSITQHIVEHLIGVFM